MEIKVKMVIICVKGCKCITEITHTQLFLFNLPIYTGLLVQLPIVVTILFMPLQSPN